MGKHAFVAMIQIETDDPILSEESLAALLGGRDAAGFRVVRQAVLAHLPHDLTRLIALLPVDHAQLLMMLHEAVGKDLAGEPFIRPPEEFERPP